MDYDDGMIEVNGYNNNGIYADDVKNGEEDDNTNYCPLPSSLIRDYRNHHHSTASYPTSPLPNTPLLPLSSPSDA